MVCPLTDHLKLTLTQWSRTGKNKKGMADAIPFKKHFEFMPFISRLCSFIKNLFHIILKV